MMFIKFVLRIPLRMKEEDLILGDDAVHGEEAYVFGPCEAHPLDSGYIQGHAVHDAPGDSGELGVGFRHHAANMDEDAEKGNKDGSNGTEVDGL